MKNLDKEKQEELAELEALKEFLGEESYNYVIESLDEDEALFQEYLDDYQQAQSKLFVIDGAEVKFNSHKGKFKVLNDTPSIQGKLVGTIIEKTPLNFTFFDGFQLLSLGEWQDVGTAKFQDRLALIQKSKIQATGQMPGSTTIESGFIEFETSGQINNPESFDPTGLPMAFYEQPDFDIKIKLIEGDFVPLGIADFEGNKENKTIKFEIEISGKGVNYWHLQIKHRGNLIKDIYSATDELKPVTVVGKAKKTNKKEEIEEKEIERYWKAGTYIVEWDGFDNNEVYDSSILTSPYELDISIVGRAEQVKKRYTIDNTRISYSQVKWVDVRIYRKLKIIETTLRVNLRDGGAEGLECSTYSNPIEPAWGQKQECPWDKIPKETLDKYKKEPIKSRTRSFEDLERLALDGINYHWGRNRNHAVAKYVEINGEKYEVFVKAINTEENAMDSMELIYNTNRGWMRSGNPGTVTGVISAFGNIFSREAVCYNVGYIKYSNGWGYQSDIDEDIEFMFTTAHEIGHEILKAFGDVYYSYGHKGSVNTITQNIKDDAPDMNLTNNDEIDIMPYYPSSNKLPYNSYSRYVVSQEDLLGLIWLTKIDVR